MSLRQCENTYEALLKDETLGLQATVEALAVSYGMTGNPGPLLAEMNFVHWALPGNPGPSNLGVNVMMAPARWTMATLHQGSPRRDASVVLETQIETFGASTDDVQDQLVLMASALEEIVVRHLVTFSAANGGSIYGVSGLDIHLVEHLSPLAGGIVATVTVHERSTTG